MISWVLKVLLAALIAFMLNSVYQAKRERKRSVSELYAAVEDYWSSIDLMAIYHSQTAAGIASWTTSHEYMRSIGLPDHKSKSRLEVLVYTDHAEIVARHELLVSKGNAVHEEAKKMAVKRISDRSLSKTYMDTDAYNNISRARDEFREETDELKAYIRKEMLRVTWRKAAKDAFLP